MGEPARLTHLDAKSLQAWINGELADALERVDLIRKDLPGGGIRALRSLVANEATPETLQQNQQFLSIGVMGGDDRVHGKALLSGLSKGAGSIDDILKEQHDLFEDMDANFREVIKVLGKTQSNNVSAIDAQDLIDIFEDIDEDMGGGSTKSKE